LRSDELSLEQGSATAVEAITFRSKNPLKLAQFYQKAFNLGDVKVSSGNHYGVYTKNVYLGFEHDLREPDRGDAVTVWFKVGNVSHFFKTLQLVGAKPRTTPDWESSRGETMATLFDPEGNVFGLISRQDPDESAAENSGQ